jgi:hypothetical protein
MTAETIARALGGRKTGGGWSVEDWQVFFDERAGIIEFDRGLPLAVLRERIIEEVESRIDMRALRRVQRRERTERQRLVDALRDIEATP